VTGGVGAAGVIHDADRLLEAAHFPLFVSVLCQGADRANSAVDLDGCPLDRPAVDEYFVFEFRGFDARAIARRVEQRDLTVTVGDGFVAAGLDPEEWGPAGRDATGRREDPAQAARLQAGQLGLKGREVS
jgi:hypothetical protein